MKLNITGFTIGVLFFMFFVFFFFLSVEESHTLKAIDKCMSNFKTGTEEKIAISVFS